MAIKSMTGFGRGEITSGDRVWTAEVRCVNNRYLDLKMKLPRAHKEVGGGGSHNSTYAHGAQHRKVV